MAKKAAKNAKEATPLRGRTADRANPAEVKHAEMLYCEKRWPPEDIAEALGRNIKTVYGWRDKYGWDETRRMFEISPTELKKMLMASALRIAKGEVRKDKEGNELREIDADAISKIMKAYDYMSGKTSPAVCRDVLIELDMWLSKTEPKVAAENTRHHRAFLMYKIQLENQ
jgi:hypothetical protein